MLKMFKNVRANKKNYFFNLKVFGQLLKKFKYLKFLKANH